MVKCMCGACVLMHYEDPFTFPHTGNIHGTKGCKIVTPHNALPKSRTCGIYEHQPDVWVYGYVDLDELRYEQKAQSDRTASRAHAEREPWHAGIDPDDP